MQDEDTMKDQFPLLDQNYQFGTEITEQQCYKIDPRIVVLLKNSGSNINARDYVNNTPIFLENYLKENVNVFWQHAMLR